MRGDSQPIIRTWPAQAKAPARTQPSPGARLNVSETLRRYIPVRPRAAPVQTPAPDPHAEKGTDYRHQDHIEPCDEACVTGGRGNQPDLLKVDAGEKHGPCQEGADEGKMGRSFRTFRRVPESFPGKWSEEKGRRGGNGQS